MVGNDVLRSGEWFRFDLDPLEHTRNVLTKKILTVFQLFLSVLDYK